MKHTLRKQSTDQDDDSPDSDGDPYAKHRRKRHIHKHANKYNEGDRKRWRNVVTERERDRYEGLWAANRGLLLSTSTAATRGVSGSWRSDSATPPPATDDEHSHDVHALIVKDIWIRSRLSAHILSEIWDLVHSSPHNLSSSTSTRDPALAPWLNKEEFVVGLWLIDQRLRGRKLPVRISDSVWDSVRLLKGIRIRGGHGVGRGRER